MPVWSFWSMPWIENLHCGLQWSGKLQRKGHPCQGDQSKLMPGARNACMSKYLLCCRESPHLASHKLEFIFHFSTCFGRIANFFVSQSSCLWNENKLGGPQPENACNAPSPAQFPARWPLKKCLVQVLLQGKFDRTCRRRYDWETLQKGRGRKSKDNDILITDNYLELGM